MVVCSKCGSDMRHVYNEEQIENAIRDIKNQFERNNIEFNMRKEFICNKQDCSFIKSLTHMEIIKEYAKAKKEEGKSDEDILKEVKNEIKRRSK